MKILILFILCLGLTHFSVAEETASQPKNSFLDQALESTKKGLNQSVDYIKNKSKEAQVQIEDKTNESADRRSNYNWGIYGHYAPIDLLIPSKKGVSFHWTTADGFEQYEAQYLKGSLSVPMLITDLGKIQDERISFLKRNFKEQSNFNWYWGISYISFDATIGPDFLNWLIPGNVIPNIDLIDIRSIGIDFGVGHSWYFKTNFSLGIDWFSISQPIYVIKKEAPYLEAQTTSTDEKDKIRKAVDTISYFPRLSFLKISLGYNF